MKKYEIKVKGATLTVIPRSYNNSYKNDYFKAPRMYVSVADESILDNLANRKRRPYNVYKTLIHSSGIASALNLSKLSWSQHAGCAMCPCSPGFVLDPQTLEIEGDTVVRFDVWVRLDNAPAIDETKPARVLVGV
jgi:hypothetical protein